MAARTSWNPRTERAPEYLDDDAYAYDPAYDDMMYQGFDEHGRLSRRRAGRLYDDEPYERSGRDDLRRAVDSLARQVEAASQQSVRPRLPALAGRPQNATIDALDRLEARLDALSGGARGRNGEPGNQAELSRQLQNQADAERSRVEAMMERHFAALDQRIAALHDLARGKNVDVIRDDLATLGDRIDGLASSGNSISGSLDQVRAQIGELGHRLESEGWNGADTLTAMKDRLELITEKLAELELTPSALSAVERGYSHILERVSRIEQLAGQNVVADDLWDRLDSFRDQLTSMQSGDGLSSIEARIAGLADNVEALSAHRGNNPAIDRLEMKLADLARTIGIIRDRRDTHSSAIEARLADITARIDKVGQDRGRIDLSPVERQISSLSARIDKLGARQPDVDLSGMERQFADLGSRIEQMLRQGDQAKDESPALQTIEARLSELQVRLEDVYSAADRTPAAADPSEALSNIDKRLGDLHARLDDVVLSTDTDPADLTPIAARLNGIDERLDGLSQEAQPSSLSVDLAVLSDKLNLIDEHVRAAPSDPATPILLDRLDAIERQITAAANNSPDVDLRALTDQLSALDKHLRQPAPAPEIDFQPVAGRLDAIDNRLETLAASPPVDTQSLAERLEAIDRRFDGLSAGGAPDLSPLNDQLVAIDRQLRGLTAGEAGAALDWSPITERLDSLDRRLADHRPGEMPDLGRLQEQLAAIDDRLDLLASGDSTAFAAAGNSSPDMSAVTDRLQAIEERISGLAAGSAEPADISPVTERLHAIEQRLAGMNTGGSEDAMANDRLVPLLETFEAALRKISTSDDISQLSEKVGNLHSALDGATETSVLDEMSDLRNDITYLRRELRSMPMMTDETEDGAGGVGQILAAINERLDNMPDGQVTFRDLEDQIGRVVRSIENGDGGAIAQIQTSLAAIEDRLAAGSANAMQEALAGMPEGDAAGGAAAIAAVAASIESSIIDLKHSTAASDDDTRRALDALNQTMEAVVSRIAYLEGGVPAAEAEYPVEPVAEPAADPVHAEVQEFHQEEEPEEIPEISIGGYTDAEAADLAAPVEEPAAYEEAEPAEYQEPAVPDDYEEQVYEAAPEAGDYDMPAVDGTVPELDADGSGYDVAVAPDDGVEPEYEAAPEDHDPGGEYEAPDIRYDTPEQPAPEAVLEPDAGQLPVTPVDDPVDVQPEPDQSEALSVEGDHEIAEGDPTVGTDPEPFGSAADLISNQPPDLDAGSQSILGRLTSSQILKRATGGRADSFTPDADEQAAPGPDTLLEPGTDTPIDSTLQDAPSSDRATPGGDDVVAAARTRQGAGLGELAAASGLGFETEEENGNQFLSAARRAARAAVQEASGADPAPDGGKPASRKKSGKWRIAQILLLALVAAAAFAGYKYWRGELRLDQLNIGGFTLAGGDDMTSASAESPMLVVAEPVFDESEAMMAPELAEDNETIELKSAMPDAAIAFAAPEIVLSAPIRSTEVIASVISKALAKLPIPNGMEGGPASADKPVPAIDRNIENVGATASLPDVPTVSNRAAKGDLTKQTDELVAAALAGTKARSAALPKPSLVRSLLPASIGSAGLRQAALANIREAQFEIASRFADGSGVRSDMAAAAYWYEKAAHQGLAPAQFRLGSLYEKGNGVTMDKVRAAQLYEEAAAAGNAKAMHNLAVLYAEGGTGEPDLPRAGKWFRNAAEHGVRDSQFNTGILYARGLGTPKDLAEAFKWFAIAAKSGDQQAAKRRDTISSSLNQDQLENALLTAGIFQPIPLKPQANLVVEPKGGWAAAAVDARPNGKQLISRIQALLAKRGFEPGPADGVMGRRTSGAIEAFQLEVGLPVTGSADLTVLTALETTVDN